MPSQSKFLNESSGFFDNVAFPKMIEWATFVNQAIAPMDFPGALHFLMKERKITVELLEERSLLSVRTIKRLRSNSDYHVTREHIVALAVGLELPPIVSMELLKKAGLIMKNTVLHNTYSMILCGMYSSTIEAVNDFLISLNMIPLTRLALLV